MADSPVPENGTEQKKRLNNENIEDKSPKSQKKGKSRKATRIVFTVLYICFLLLMVAGVFAAIEYYAYLKIKSSPLGEAYKGKNLDLARQSSQKVAPQYGYEPTPGFAAVRNTKLGNSPEYINEESFKDFKDVPEDKPADEFRILVTGGSVVYGRGPVPPADAVADYYEVTFRWTIPHLMEKILNADPRIRKKIGNKNIRVVNAGVPGYVYQNSLMRYLAKLRLFKPDAVVALDGANEVHTVARPLKDWNYFTEGPYFEVVSEVLDMSRKGLMNYVTLWLKRNTYLFTWLAMKEGEGPGILMENRGFAAHAQDATPEMIEYRNKNIKQVADVMAIYHKTLEVDGVPHVFALQPMFRNSKKQRTPMEQKIESITGMRKIGFYDAAETYNKFVKTVKDRGNEINFEVLDLTDIYDNVTEWVFTDWCHLTNGANYILAKKLANQVKTQIFNLPLGPSDALTTPYDEYFKDYAAKSQILVNGAPHGGDTQILQGYPGKDTLEVASNESSPSNVTLDFGYVTHISRLRIVWGDKASVPKGWRVDVSEDGKEWTPWIKKEETVTDNYDQWPGYEFYAFEEIPARYVRYTPAGPEKEIKLRQLSVFK